MGYSTSGSPSRPSQFLNAPAATYIRIPLFRYDNNIFDNLRKTPTHINISPYSLKP